MSTICGQCKGIGELDKYDYQSGLKIGTQTCFICEGSGEIIDIKIHGGK